MVSPATFLINNANTSLDQSKLLTSNFNIGLIIGVSIGAFFVSLTVVVWCAWRHLHSTDTASDHQPSDLRSSAIRDLPKYIYNGTGNEGPADCVICLADYVDGEEIRLLPDCGHGFHTECIETWFLSNYPCPSCHLIPVRCQNCSEVPSRVSINSADLEGGIQP